MRLLRKRLRADNIPNERRVTRGAGGRIVYLAFLALFCAAVLNYLFGDLVLLRADGLVLRDENVVATTYIARVDRVDVQQGATVKEGSPLLKLQSLEILERLADLSIKRAELVAKATELKIRGETVDQLLPLAVRHELEATRVIRQFDGVTEGGFITSVRWEQALRANYDALLDRVKLSAESHVLNEEKKALQVALDDADTALAELKTHYADGQVLAPISGSVGVAVPYAGNVYRPGDPILSIYSGDPHVLVYLPRRYLFPIYVGMQLQVTDGQHTESGVIAEILPVTATLPKEFQNTFQPSDRNQLARVKLASAAQFPLNQKVSVSRPHFFYFYSPSGDHCLSLPQTQSC
jgi:multidrug resistance efflux pump